ncbi:hypothetical protein DFH06DRAFT_1333751 [Mycena polygramma]|nr:hypothetical protein DFH06DRAFT_1333749 [Mycena polygramma]KAJ7642962.1 hypothetical protein DFH06DRAFT_1333751 [Mycena polygramma]
MRLSPVLATLVLCAANFQLAASTPTPLAPGGVVVEARDRKGYDILYDEVEKRDRKGYDILYDEVEKRDRKGYDILYDEVETSVDKRDRKGYDILYDEVETRNLAA